MGEQSHTIEKVDEGVYSVLRKEDQRQPARGQNGHKMGLHIP